MPSRYHPIEDGLWDDSKFDQFADLHDAHFYERAFFAWLCANKFQRPAGIYRASDEELTVSSHGLTIRQVRAHILALQRRGLVIRDGAWIFVISYFKRLPKTPHLLKAAEQCVKDCPSDTIIRAFSLKYPMFSRWSTDRLETIKQRSGDPLSLLALGEERRGEERRGTGEGVQGVETAGAKESPEDLQALWNEVGSSSRQNGLPGFVECRDLGATRRAKAGARLKEAELAWHRQAITRLVQSRFACGEPKKDGSRWRASFDWYIANDTNCLKAYEGKYD